MCKRCKSMEIESRLLVTSHWWGGSWGKWEVTTKWYWRFLYRIVTYSKLIIVMIAQLCENTNKLNCALKKRKSTVSGVRPELDSQFHHTLSIELGKVI